MTRVTRAMLSMTIAVFLAATGCSRAQAPRPAPYALPSSYTPSSPEAEQRDIPLTTQDLRILDRAEAILSDSAKWNRQDDRICTPADTTWSLFCALQRASVEVLGAYDHRRAALQEVRFAIEAAAPGKQFEHRLRDYNNLSTTRFEDIKRVLHAARQRVAYRLGMTKE